MEFVQMKNFASQLVTINNKLDRLIVNSLQSNVVRNLCRKSHYRGMSLGGWYLQTWSKHHMWGIPTDKTTLTPILIILIGGITPTFLGATT